MLHLPSHVFLSHATEDKAFVERLRADLEAQGARTWMDAQELYAGDMLPRRIAQAITAASAFIVVISPVGITSPWVSYELQIAVNLLIQGKLTLIPAKIADAEMPAEISTMVLYADFRSDYDGGLQTIVRALEQLEQDDPWVQHDVERLLDEVFDGRGVTSLAGEYRSISYDFVEVDMASAGGGEAVITYEIERALGEPPRAISTRYWSEYVDALDDLPEPYRLLITERPVEADIPEIVGTRGRLRLHERKAPPTLLREYVPTAFVLDISGDLAADEQLRLLQIARDLVHEREAAYLRAVRARS